MQEVENINLRRAALFVKKVRDAVWVLQGKKIGVLGLAFKGGTDDIRESPALNVVKTLIGEGARLQVHDPQAIEATRRELPFDLEKAIALYRFSERSGYEIHSSVASAPDLVIPATFRVPYKRMLKSPIEELQPNGTYAADLLSNVAEFVPLGFFVCAYLRTAGLGKWAAILCTIVAGAFLSSLIEVLQAYIPQRGSGMTDIITNTIGSAVGALIARSDFRQCLGSSGAKVSWLGRDLVKS